MNIHEYLALPHRFRWGGVGGEDCMTFAARWALEVIGIDPAEHLRGTYRSKSEAHAILEAHGGHLKLMEMYAAQIGAKRVQQPQDGDVGLIRAMTGETYDEQAETMMGAVRFGPLWACIHPGGVRATPAEFISAWRLPA